MDYGGVRLINIYAPLIVVFRSAECCQLRPSLIQVCTKMCTKFSASRKWRRLGCKLRAPTLIGAVGHQLWLAKLCKSRGRKKA
jgi:hypothetical protein